MQQGPHADQWGLPHSFYTNSTACCAGDLLWAGRLIRVLSSSCGILLDCTEDTDVEDSKEFLNPSFLKLTARITSPISEVTAPVACSRAWFDITPAGLSILMPTWLSMSLEGKKYRKTALYSFSFNPVSRCQEFVLQWKILQIAWGRWWGVFWGWFFVLFVFFFF